MSVSSGEENKFQKGFFSDNDYSSARMSNTKDTKDSKSSKAFEGILIKRNPDNPDEYTIKISLLSADERKDMTELERPLTEDTYFWVSISAPNEAAALAWAKGIKKEFKAKAEVKTQLVARKVFEKDNFDAKNDTTIEKRRQTLDKMLQIGDTYHVEMDESTNLPKYITPCNQEIKNRSFGSFALSDKLSEKAIENFGKRLETFITIHGLALPKILLVSTGKEALSTTTEAKEKTGAKNIYEYIKHEGKFNASHLYFCFANRYKEDSELKDQGIVKAEERLKAFLQRFKEKVDEKTPTEISEEEEIQEAASTTIKSSQPKQAATSAETLEQEFLERSPKHEGIEIPIDPKSRDKSVFEESLSVKEHQAQSHNTSTNIIEHSVTKDPIITAHSPSVTDPSKKLSLKDYPGKGKEINIKTSLGNSKEVGTADRVSSLTENSSDPNKKLTKVEVKEVPTKKHTVETTNPKNMASDEDEKLPLQSYRNKTNGLPIATTLQQAFGIQKDSSKEIEFTKFEKLNTASNRVFTAIDDLLEVAKRITPSTNFYPVPGNISELASPSLQTISVQIDTPKENSEVASSIKFLDSLQQQEPNFYNLNTTVKEILTSQKSNPKVKPLDELRVGDTDLISHDTSKIVESKISDVLTVPENSQQVSKKIDAPEIIYLSRSKDGKKRKAIEVSIGTQGELIDAYLALKKQKDANAEPNGIDLKVEDGINNPELIFYAKILKKRNLDKIELNKRQKTSYNNNLEQVPHILLKGVQIKEERTDNSIKDNTRVTRVEPPSNQKPFPFGPPSYIENSGIAKAPTVPSDVPTNFNSEERLPDSPPAEKNRFDENDIENSTTSDQETENEGKAPLSEQNEQSREDTTNNNDDKQIPTLESITTAPEATNSQKDLLDENTKEEDTLPTLNDPVEQTMKDRDDRTDLNEESPKDLFKEEPSSTQQANKTETTIEDPQAATTIPDELSNKATEQTVVNDTPPTSDEPKGTPNLNTLASADEDFLKYIGNGIFEDKKATSKIDEGEDNLKNSDDDDAVVPSNDDRKLEDQSFVEDRNEDSKKALTKLTEDLKNEENTPSGLNDFVEQTVENRDDSTDLNKELSENIVKEEPTPDEQVTVAPSTGSSTSVKIEPEILQDPPEAVVKEFQTTTTDKSSHSPRKQKSEDNGQPILEKTIEEVKDTGETISSEQREFTTDRTPQNFLASGEANNFENTDINNATRAALDKVSNEQATELENPSKKELQISFLTALGKELEDHLNQLPRANSRESEISNLFSIEDSLENELEELDIGIKKGRDPIKDVHTILDSLQLATEDLIEQKHVLQDPLINTENIQGIKVQGIGQREIPKEIYDKLKLAEQTLENFEKKYTQYKKLETEQKSILEEYNRNLRTEDNLRQKVAEYKDMLTSKQAREREANAIQEELKDYEACIEQMRSDKDRLEQNQEELQKALSQLKKSIEDLQKQKEVNPDPDRARIKDLSSEKKDKLNAELNELKRNYEQYFGKAAKIDVDNEIEASLQTKQRNTQLRQEIKTLDLEVHNVQAKLISLKSNIIQRYGPRALDSIQPEKSSVDNLEAYKPPSIPDLKEFTVQPDLLMEEAQQRPEEKKVNLETIKLSKREHPRGWKARLAPTHPVTTNKFANEHGTVKEGAKEFSSYIFNANSFKKALRSIQDKLTKLEKQTEQPLQPVSSSPATVVYRKAPQSIENECIDISNAVKEIRKTLSTIDTQDLSWKNFEQNIALQVKAISDSVGHINLVQTIDENNLLNNSATSTTDSKRHIQPLSNYVSHNFNEFLKELETEIDSLNTDLNKQHTSLDKKTIEIEKLIEDERTTLQTLETSITREKEELKTLKDSFKTFTPGKEIKANEKKLKEYKENFEKLDKRLIYLDEAVNSLKGTYKNKLLEKEIATRNSINADIDEINKLKKDLESTTNLLRLSTLKANNEQLIEIKDELGEKLNEMTFLTIQLEEKFPDDFISIAHASRSPDYEGADKPKASREQKNKTTFKASSVENNETLSNPKLFPGEAAENKATIDLKEDRTEKKLLENAKPVQSTEDVEGKVTSPKNFTKASEIGTPQFSNVQEDQEILDLNPDDIKEISATTVNPSDKLEEPTILASIVDKNINIRPAPDGKLQVEQVKAKSKKNSKKTSNFISSTAPAKVNTEDAIEEERKRKKYMIDQMAYALYIHMKTLEKNKVLLPDFKELVSKDNIEELQGIIQSYISKQPYSALSKPLEEKTELKQNIITNLEEIEEKLRRYLFNNNTHLDNFRPEKMSKKSIDSSKQNEASGEQNKQ
ncbi:MAG: hypothetical protein K0S74_472 [Chlamydiales bacterium]|jgi:hypothetical protein|nr:hypothetical protein [Chlamydiales bacterium]